MNNTEIQRAEQERQAANLLRFFIKKSFDDGYEMGSAGGGRLIFCLSEDTITLLVGQLFRILKGV